MLAKGMLPARTLAMGHHFPAGDHRRWSRHLGAGAVDLWDSRLKNGSPADYAVE